MIADVVYLDAAEDNWRDSKPPLAGWAIEAIYLKTGDREFVREMYPKLTAYHDFWYQDRDHDGDGLCEYGSTDGTLEAARWESGMDNAVRFDQTGMLQNGPQAMASVKALVAEVALSFLDDDLIADTAERIAETRASEEGREGLSAYLEKRKPNWIRG